MIEAMSCSMPVLVEVPVNHEAVKSMPEDLQSRINFKKTTEEVAADSERMSARSELLREAHLRAVRERAARETQRGEEAAARKRRAAADDLRKLEEKIEAASAKSEARKREQQEKRDAEKTRRSALAEAVAEARQATHVATIKKGIEKATRACAAVTAREKKVAEVVKRTGAQVKHALAVAASMKEKNTARGEGDDETPIQPLDSPHPVSILDSERLASPHPVHHQLQQQVEQQIQLHNPSALQKLMSTNTSTTSSNSENSNSQSSNSSRSSTPRRSMGTPRQPSMMTIAEDRELMTDHRSQAFERCWFKEQTSAGKVVWSYMIKWDDGTCRTVRGLA
jgi:hypothetical protein